MKIKQEKGFTSIDIVIAVIAVIIFSTLIVTLIYNNFMENVKLKRENMAMIYITEIFENIGIEKYEKLENGNYIDIGNNSYNNTIENLIPKEIIGQYNIDLTITNELENVNNDEDIIKKIIVTLTYKVKDKQYVCSMQRMKIKE